MLAQHFDQLYAQTTITDCYSNPTSIHRFPHMSSPIMRSVEKIRFKSDSLLDLTLMAGSNSYATRGASTLDSAEDMTNVFLSSFNVIPLTLREAKLKELCNSFKTKYLERTREHLQLERELIMSNASFERISVDLNSLKSTRKQLEDQLHSLEHENSALRIENKKLLTKLEKTKKPQSHKATELHETSKLDSSGERNPSSDYKEFSKAKSLITERINAIKLELMASENNLKKSSAAMAEDTWSSISISLKSLLSKYDLDLTGVGATQRLAYTDFETIFYHLFMIIDPSDCRRKFWALYPTRNQDEKARFIDESTQFINSKQLSTQRVTPSQLRMCGGEPFRRLLMSLIKKAAESEIAVIEKRLPKPMEDSTTSELLLNLDQLKVEGQQKTEVIQKMIIKYSQVQEMLAKKEEETNQLWKILTDDNKDSFYIDNKKPAREIYKSLLDKLEKNDLRRKAAAFKIKQVSMPRNPAIDFNSPVVARTKVPTRMSYLFREIRQHLTLTPNNPSAEPPKSKEKENLFDQLSYYDNSVDELLSIWEIELEKADEALLSNKDTKAKYVVWQQLIPFLNITPIGLGQDKKSLSNPENLSELQDILKEYPDPRYDDDEISRLWNASFASLKT